MNRRTPTIEAFLRRNRMLPQLVDFRACVDAYIDDMRRGLDGSRPCP